MCFSIINPVTNIMDQCVRKLWYATEKFWDGGVSDAQSINSDPSATFHLAIYGELFGPDLETYFSDNSSAARLSLDTRLEYIKYCVPDLHILTRRETGSDVNRLDPRRFVENTHPYALEYRDTLCKDNKTALMWVLQSSRWCIHWKAIYAKAGPRFSDEIDNENHEIRCGSENSHHWHQRLWDHYLLCQGLQELQMILPWGQDRWLPRIREWRDRVARLESEPKYITEEHEPTVRGYESGRGPTYEFPYIPGELRNFYERA